MTDGRRATARIDAEHAIDDVERIEAEGDEIGGDGATTSHTRVDRLAAAQATTPSDTAPATAITIQTSHSPGDLASWQRRHADPPLTAHGSRKDEGCRREKTPARNAGRSVLDICQNPPNKRCQPRVSGARLLRQDQIGCGSGHPSACLLAYRKRCDTVWNIVSVAARQGEEMVNEASSA